MASQDNMTVWRDCIRAWYPDYETKTYFVPPVVITRIPFDVVPVAGQSVLVPQCNPVQVSATQSTSTQVKFQPSSTQVKLQQVQECQTRDDLALQRVLLSLRELVSEQSEPMFVISQLQFSGYLGQPCYAAAVKQFLRPQNLHKDHRRGDFDILVIHRHYGIITGEIKSVLSSQQQIQLSQPDVDRAVTDRVRNAINQLNKSQVVLREITKDLDPNLAIRKLLILPYVTADILTRVVSSDEHLKQDLVTCLQAEDFEQALQCCLLDENLSSNETETANDQQRKLKAWFSTFRSMISDLYLDLLARIWSPVSRLKILSKPSCAETADVQQTARKKLFSTFSDMTPDVYLDLLARFCGPATTVSVHCPTSPRIEIRTEGQGVAVTGERMTSLVLTPEQISLLTRAPTKVFLTGPPGVGKSVMLVLIALTWLRQGHDVHLVIVWIESIAATRMINHVIQVSMRDDATTPSTVGRVYLHEYDFYEIETDVDKAINTLTATRGSHGPYVICDEFFTYSHIARYHRFVTDLCTRLPNVCLWAASPYHHQRPAELQEERMTTPLRCPPAVLSEVQRAVSSNVHPYTTTALATPCDGPKVIHLSHQGPVHAGRWPLECVKCGQLIAGILQRLGVGVTDFAVKILMNTVTTTAATAKSHTATANVNKTTACPPLQYSDVFVLTRSLDLRDDVKDKAARVTSTANGVVRGLRDAGIPVRVIREGHGSTDVCDTAVRQSDVVTVTFYGAVHGLERKVVVWLPGRIPGVDDNLTEEKIEFDVRLLAMSRCTAQLVVVDVPVSDGDRNVVVQTTKSRRRCCVS